jgi:hypothetical protein
MSLFSRLFPQKDGTDPAAPPAADENASAQPPEGEEAEIAVEEDGEHAAALPQALVQPDETDPMPIIAVEPDAIETRIDTAELEAFVEAEPEPVIAAQGEDEIDPEALARPLPPAPPPLPPPPPRRGRRERTGRHSKSKLAPGLTPPLRQSSAREADRREPLIVKALLRQVPGLEPVAIERLRAAGLSRLDALARASASEMTTDAGLPDEVARAVVSTVRAFRSKLTDAEVVGHRGHVEPLVATLEAQHQAYEHASLAWSAESLAAKKRLRRARAQAYVQVELALARLGEADLLVRLEPLPFAGKISELRRFLNPTPPEPPPPRETTTPEAPLTTEEGTQDGRPDT